MVSKRSGTVSHDLLFTQGQETMLDALGDHTRRSILERLKTGPKPVVEIARGLPVSRPAVSQHLKVLKAAGLVLDRPEANRRIYSVDPAGLASLRSYLDSFWSEAFTRFTEAAEVSLPGEPDE